MIEYILVGLGIVLILFVVLFTIRVYRMQKNITDLEISTANLRKSFLFMIEGSKVANQLAKQTTEALDKLAGEFYEHQQNMVQFVYATTEFLEKYTKSSNNTKIPVPFSDKTKLN